ncbi:MAG: ABC transporter permease subunit [Actinobacteria bacterium]|uniref:Unannotated protein n=1 Tax=freshwater metagenome TaxID=449393 RepID=A0A6J6SWE9_9ZZZZ|nr:ABC transporter permease subunit [Actinomycetota bacterium]MSY70278.1 ABC transporter permease subunit [Actinomycetota bacterium]MTA76577.1 ABC transporter permease subunit [Actinomycetota bacterium]
MKNGFSRILGRLWFPLTLVALWQIALSSSKNPFFPTPLTILRNTQSVISLDWARTSLLSSLITLFAGYFIGSTLGVVLGAIIGINERVRVVLNPIANFIRSIPSVAKVPVLMALMGIGTATRISAVAVAVLFPVLMASMRAIATTDDQLMDISKIMHYSKYQVLLKVRIPAATGEILAGLHAAVQIAVLVMVISEMLGSGIGLGAFIIHSQSSFMIADMWVGILVLGVIGSILNELFQFAERRIAPWYFKSKELA